MTAPMDPNGNLIDPLAAVDTTPAGSSSSGSSVYTVPPAGSGNATSSSSGYSYNANDPYDLGVLANTPLIVGTQTVKVPGHTTETPHAYGMYGEHGGPGSNTGEDGLLTAGLQNDHPYQVTPGSTKDELVHVTATQYVRNFLKMYGTNRSEFDALRGQLAQAGYYGSTSAQRLMGRTAGSWDVGAIRSAIQDYERYAQSTGNPQTFPEWLQGSPNGANNSAASGGSGAGTVSLTDPAQLAMYAQRAAAASLGHELSQSQLDQFVAQFHAQEQGNQDAAMSGAPKVTSSDARSEAIQFIQKNYAGQENQHSAEGYMNAFMNLFLPSSSQRQTINTDPNAVSY